MKSEKQPFFLPEDQPLSTCIESDCTNCDVNDRISCHFTTRDLVTFLAAMLPTFIFGGKLVFASNPFYLLLWLGGIVLYFGFLEIRVMCSHCPHYAEPSTKTLKCWANYGAPKIWKYRPYPMTIIEKFLFIAGMAVTVLSPIVFAIIRAEVFNTILFALLVISSFSVLFRFYCTRCMNFACPFNRTPSSTREKFLLHNPDIMLDPKQSNDQPPQ